MTGLFISPFSQAKTRLFKLHALAMLDPISILTDGVKSGLHLGAQLFVSYRAKPQIDFACGEAQPDIPLGVDSIVPWFSAGKPLTAICIAQLYERGELLLDDKIARFLPAFGGNGKDSITLWHLLTHTGGFRAADNLPRHIEWGKAIELICEAPIEPGWAPGEKAGYSTQAAWFILAEIIQRITKTSFADYVRRELLEPLQMADSWLCLPPAQRDAYGDRVALMFETSGGKRNLAPLQDSAGMSICRPGASARGPIRELARFYAMLLNQGELDGRRCLRPETIKLFTSRQREGLYDHTFAHTLDYGFGFILNSNRYGIETVPYGYGRHASEESFGHSGAQSSCAFADPRHDLIVAWVANGMPGERAHQVRQRELNSTIYQHLGIFVN
jgi:CubicO group peptidase (beta-lactamase class C family)